MVRGWLYWTAAATIALMREMLSVLMGQVESVATHSASPSPQPHVQRAAFACLKAVRFCGALSPEKSTTPRARSPYATLFDDRP